jgi:hypothetical protein
MQHSTLCAQCDIMAHSAVQSITSKSHTCLQGYCDARVSTFHMPAPTNTVQTGQCMVALPCRLLEWASSFRDETAAANVWLHGLYFYAPAPLFGIDFLVWSTTNAANLWMTDISIQGEGGAACSCDVNFGVGIFVFQPAFLQGSASGLLLDWLSLQASQQLTKSSDYCCHVCPNQWSFPPYKHCRELVMT